MSATTKFDRRKETIVRAAISILNRKGVRGMTLPLVAAELDLVPRAVSYYFRRKEDLAAACYGRSIARMDQLVTDALQATTASAIIRALVRHFFEMQRQIETGEHEPIAWFEDMRTVHDPQSGEAFTNLFRKVREIFKAPGAPDYDAIERNARTHLLLSQLFWSVLWLPRYNTEDYTRMGERTADILLNGIAAPRAKWAPPVIALIGEEEAGPSFLRAATELINEQGYLGASVNKISARLNVTKGSFYHHNEAKDDLVEQCFERTWNILRRAQMAADHVATNGLMNLAAQAIATVAGQVSNEHPLLRTSALAAVPEEMRPRLLAGFSRITARYASVVSDGVKDGSVRPLDVLLAAEVLSGAINAAAELRYWAPKLSVATAATHYIRPLFAGLLSPPA